MVYRVMQGDLRYRVPIDGVAGMAIWLIARVVIKIIIDFTG